MGDMLYQVGGHSDGFLYVVARVANRLALLSWTRGRAACVHLDGREVRYINDLDEAAACAAAEVTHEEQSDG